MQHIIYLSGLCVIIGNMEVVLSMSRPHDVNWLRAFLRLCNYCKKFLKAFNAIAKAVTMQTRNDQP